MSICVPCSGPSTRSECCVLLQEEVYLTGKQPPKEQTVFEAASCGIKPAWSDAAGLTPEGSATLSRGVSLFNGSQVDMSARSALLKLEMSPRTHSSRYVPPVQRSVEEVGTFPFSVDAGAPFGAAERPHSHGLGGHFSAGHHRLPSRQSLAAAKDALAEADTNSVLQPWDLTNHLAGALTQRSRGGLSRSLHNVAELAVAIEDDAQQRAASLAASRSRHASRPSSPLPLPNFVEGVDVPRRCKSSSAGQSRPESRPAGSFRRVASLRRVRWPDEDRDDDELRRSDSRGRRHNDGRPVGESGGAQAEAPEISLLVDAERAVDARATAAPQQTGRRGTRSRSRRAASRAPRESGAIGANQSAARSSASLRYRVPEAAAPPPNASVPAPVHHRPHARSAAETYTSLRDLYATSARPNSVAASARLTPNAGAAAAAAAMQAQDLPTTDIVVSGEVSSASEPHPVSHSLPPQARLNTQAPAANLRDGPAEMLLDSGSANRLPRPRGAGVTHSQTQRQLLTRSHREARQRASNGPDSPSMHGSLPGMLTSGQLDSDWHGASMPLSSDHEGSIHNSFDPYGSITRHLPGALSTLGSLHRTMPGGNGPGRGSSAASPTKSAADAAFGSIASVPPPSSARSGYASRVERSMPAQPEAVDGKQPQHVQPLKRVAGSRTSGPPPRSHHGAGSNAESGSSFMAPLVNWTRARAQAGRQGVGSFFGAAAPPPGPRDLEWGDPAEEDWQDAPTPREESREAAPWLHPAQLSWAETDNAALINSAMLRSTRSLRRTSMSRSLAQRLNHEHGTDGGSDDIRFRRRRPDFVKIFDDAQAEARRLGEDRVAVLVCGNEGVLKRCLKQCMAHCGDVRFDCHYEAFSFG